MAFRIRRPAPRFAATRVRQLCDCVRVSLRRKIPIRRLLSSSIAFSAPSSRPISHIVPHDSIIVRGPVAVQEKVKVTKMSGSPIH